MNQERRQPKWWQKVNAAIPAVALAVLVWMASNVWNMPKVEAKIDTAIASIATLRQDLIEHNESSKAMALRNSADHHRAVGITPCDGCHRR